MIMDDNEDVQIPTIDDFSLEYLDELQEDAVPNRRTRPSHCGDVKYLRVGVKGVHPRKAKWMEVSRVRNLYPHLLVD